MLTLKEYLYKELEASTAKQYLRRLDHFFVSLEQQNINPQTATYQQLLNYIGELRAKNTYPRDSLNAIKRYYSYLIAIGVREDHPAKNIILKDKINREVQLQDLFTTKELELVLEQVIARYPGFLYRNRSIVSLLIYQGLTTLELIRLKIEDINLEKATVFIREGVKSKARTLKLRGSQIYLLLQYIEVERKELNKQRRDELFLTARATSIDGNTVVHLIKHHKHLFPNRSLSPKAIRKSVITNLLKNGENLRVVQAFAGHRNPSSTQKYQQTQVEELKQELLKHHPLQ